ncbi:MAG: hypothetical protein IPJ19_18970, partial [Planctomycetes bacterium]|nr:hypothetical protein [Planctomycetota bacterium]
GSGEKYKKCHGKNSRKDAPAPIPPPLVGDPTPGFARFALHLLYDGVWALAFVLCSPWWLVRGALDARFRALSIARTFGSCPLRARRTPARACWCTASRWGRSRPARPLVEALSQERRSCLDRHRHGLRRRAQVYPGRTVVRFPLDFSPLVARFLTGVDPEAVLLIELELWPSFLRVCNKRGIPLCVANGRITERSFPRYKLFKSLLPQFARISLFCAQDEEYAARFRELGADPRACSSRATSRPTA